jgi:hypothetical protein
MIRFYKFYKFCGLLVSRKENICISLVLVGILSKKEMASEKINKIQCVARNTINKVKNTVNIYK